MRELGELKEDTKEIKKDIRDFIAAANEKFAPRKEVDKLKDEVDKQKYNWAWASGFAAAIVFAIEKASKLF
jgi:phage host-nuclease inhibitor protein Gam